MDDCTTKACTKCGTEYPLTADYYPRNKNEKSGFSYWCKKCNAENTRKWQYDNPDKYRLSREQWKQKNPDRVRKYAREYRRANPDKARAWDRRWQKAHPENMRANNHKWEQSNPDKKRERGRRRRALKHTAEGFHTEAEVQALYQQQQGRCFHCASDLSAGFERDHWIPLSRGGSDWITNIRLLCPPCNRTKNDKLPHEWHDKYKDGSA